jgi:hypothetical protein
MILTGILRHYLSTLLQSTPKRQLLAKIREQRSLGRAQNLRNNYQQVSKAAFERRKEAFLDGTKDGRFLADPDAESHERPGDDGGHDGHDERQRGHDGAAEFDHGLDQCFLQRICD